MISWLVYSLAMAAMVQSLGAQTTAPAAASPAAAPAVGGSSAGNPAAAVKAGNEEVRKVMETFKGRGVMRDNTPPTPPSEALKTFQMRDGFAIDMMASEPEACQPLYMSWDSRGRMWVTQYLQYQFPAGLKILSYDQHLRAVYDKVPEPPPRGMKGADQVTIFEDTKGTGTFDQHKVAISGLNIATAAIKGAGGIWVMNAPYLLFYPDANDDDIPDGDPQVMLSGFGMEDTHSVANSLHWGPDGWLYGANGSTTTANISSAVTKNVRFQGQHIWRYNPRTKVFEIYAEGGGNTFSCEFDAQGRVFSGTNGAARGMHYDQGMSGVKAFGKHGPPDNPYGFGYFDHMETKSDNKRFSQAFCIYDGGLMDAALGGHFIAANALQNMVYVSRRVPVTSTFRAEDEEPLLHCTDRWFRPVDIKVGPDGCIYLADWYDTRLSHVSPVDDWSKTDGRIYRVRPTGANVALKPFNLHTAPVSELIGYLSHANRWFRQQAALELGWREDKSALPQLEKLARDPKNSHAVDALFAIHMLGGLDDNLAMDLLKHPDPYVRRWVVRCAGDRNETSTLLASGLKSLAATEQQPEVRTQLLCSAKRLPAEAGLPIVRTMMERNEDMQDQRIPLLLWWAVESKAVSDRDAVLALFEDPKVWDFQLARTYGAQYLAKRWAMAGGTENYDACAKLLALAKRSQDQAVVIEGVASAFEGGKLPELPPALSGPLIAYFKSQMDSDLAMAVKTGNADAAKKALAIVADKNAPPVKRISLLEALAQSGDKRVVPVIEATFASTGDIPLKKTALAEASRFDDVKIAQSAVASYEAKLAGDPAVRDATHRMLVSRKDWARIFLGEVEFHHIKEKNVAPDVVRQIGQYHDAEMDALVKKYWPSSDLKLSNAQVVAEANRIKALLANGLGDPAKGKVTFTQRCSICHTLFGEGGHVGPELTGYERTNKDFWLVAILSPSAEIREGFGAYICKVKDGQIFTGLIDKQDAGGVVIRDVAGQKHAVKQSDIESLEASPISLMPEGMLGGLSDAELKDLFAFLMQ
ncbi:MAG: PVC-type heme-binding CxxCH protein [Chthoniobacter sp.]|uniref:PVC-type heme-binding CxxCH protein n=1 Tax=Chthoniobacter sp. TaxID=2510640 RepID=UPI0032A56230